uniref:Uncharacterized protein n=1 Tax=Cynoglossus semilaevis TaxID=244447 RepID=A0A3P8V1J0_CYNSE
MTEAMEARTSTTTTMVIDSKTADAGSASARKKTFTDDLYSTFSSPLAWILVLALIVTWSCVFVIMFDLMDHKAISGTTRSLFGSSNRPPPLARKVLKDSGPRGGLTKLGSDPMKAVNDVVEESGNVISVLYRFAANLIAPGEDDGTFHKAEESNHVNVNASLHFMLTMLTISRLK